jgi:hypothetical protein
MARHLFNQWSGEVVHQESPFTAKSSEVGGKYSLEISLALIERYIEQMNSRNYILICINVLSLKVAEDHPL